MVFLRGGEEKEEECEEEFYQDLYYNLIRWRCIKEIGVMLF